MMHHDGSGELKREIGPFSAVNLVIANMVGTGIFTTSGFMMQALGDPGAMLLCWLAGGLFALSGALCYAELGARFPRAGGEYVFLRESFGSATAFLSGWISLVVGFSAPIAAAAIAFATYLLRVLPAGGIPAGAPGAMPLSAVSLTASAAIMLLTLAHTRSLRLGKGVQNLLTLFKVGFIVCFICLGIWKGEGSAAHFASGDITGKLLDARFAVAMIFVSFSFSGWNAAAYIGGEIRNPRRNIPLALIAGTSIVICLYLLLNGVYVWALSPAEMSGIVDIGAAAAAALFGDAVGRYLSAAIAVGLLSTLSAMIVTGPRVYYSMAKDGMFFRLFGKIDARHQTPGRAVCLQAGLAVFMVLTASFERLLLYIGFTLSLFSMLAVVGMIKLRLTDPGRVPSYRTPGYPVTPLVFIAGNLWIIGYSILTRPVAALWALTTIAAGMLVFWQFRRQDAQDGTAPEVTWIGEAAPSSPAMPEPKPRSRF
jgi:APA family basic amino acid/polyamine antiporter